MAVCMPIGKAGGQGGFSYIGILITLAIAALGLSGAAVVWQMQMQRLNEMTLLETGEAYRVAIGRYYEATPGAFKEYPRRLQELVEDKRFPVPRRHLRRLLPDPFAPRQPMGLILQQEAIVGVFSTSSLAPVRSKGYLEIEAGFESVKKYSDWRFVYTPNSLSELESQIVNRVL